MFHLETMLFSICPT